MTEEQVREIVRCSHDAEHFIRRYVQIYDATLRRWVPFMLWAFQVGILRSFLENRLHILLKARQVGLTWLCLAYVLWLMLFRPAATALIFSKTERDSIYLLGKERLRGMYARLPDWMKANRVLSNDKLTWELSNGSIARAFPSTGGDSFTATIAVVDEADMLTDDEQVDLHNAVEPTVSGGGWLIRLSKSDKSRPHSMFKQDFRRASEGRSSAVPHFIPWHARPGRDQAWYDQKTTEYHSVDDMHENYPATAAEALAPKSSSKRIPYNVVLGCHEVIEPLSADIVREVVAEFNGGLAEEKRVELPHPALRLYRLPEKGRHYVLGADPAEGNPTSDDSALVIIDRDTWEEVGELHEKLEPEVFARLSDAVGRFYNRASVLVERNNHGHTVLLWLKHNSPLTRMRGEDGRPGHLTTGKSKTMMFNSLAQILHEKDTTIHSQETVLQIASVEGDTLKAPPGEHDDCAMAYGIALVAAKKPRATVV